MNIILQDLNPYRRQLLPFTFTRPVAGIRVGILTIAEKWELWMETAPSYHAEEYLQDKFPITMGEDNMVINGALCPDDEVYGALLSLSSGASLWAGNEFLAMRGDAQMVEAYLNGNHIPHEKIDLATEPVLIRYPWDIFQQNGAQIRKDFTKISKARRTERITDRHTVIYNEVDIFVGANVKVRAAVLNAEDGPIYIGDGAEIQEGSVIRGPFALGEGSVVNMGSKVRPDTTVGPYSKVGGELNNAVIFGYSNKGHEGFLGNSVIGEWCNLGADTNTSNLKNNYGEVKVYSHEEGKMVGTGLQFCGLLMGDHSKCGINTMFNTGTVVGVSANIYGGDFPPKFIPSFSWGGAGGFEEFQLDKVYEVADRVMSRRMVELTQADRDILAHVMEETASQREQ